MTVLYLIRHGQASFGAADYDRLSPRGMRQSELLGAHLRQTQPPFDAIYTGGLRRHRETARAAGLVRQEGSPPGTLPAFDEYDHMGIIRAYLPRFMEEVGRAQGLEEGELRADHPLFELAFRFMIRAWMNEESHGDRDLESWPGFCRRVEGGLRTLLEAHGSGARVAVFTSGGVVATALRQVLGLSNKRTLSVNWTIYNASVTQLFYGRSRRHEDALVLGFNSVAHLELAGDRELITFR